MNIKRLVEGNLFDLPSEEGKKAAWFTHFASKIMDYARKYDIPDDEAADVVVSCKCYTYWYELSQQFDKESKKIQVYKTLVLDGLLALGEELISEPPNISVLVNTPPPPITPGALYRAVEIANRILRHPNYSQKDGIELKINNKIFVGDLDYLQPKLTLLTNKFGNPEIHWDKRQIEGIDIFVKRVGSFDLMVSASSPRITDYYPLPVGKTETWEYKGICRHKGKLIGRWSEVQSIKVGKK